MTIRVPIQFMFRILCKIDIFRRQFLKLCFKLLKSLLNQYLLIYRHFTKEKAQKISTFQISVYMHSTENSKFFENHVICKKH